MEQAIENNGGDTDRLTGIPGPSAYSASKFGVIGLSELLAHEVLRNNIRVMALTPSTVATDLSIGSLIPEDKADQYMHPHVLAEYNHTQLNLDPMSDIK